MFYARTINENTALLAPPRFRLDQFIPKHGRPPRFNGRKARIALLVAAILFIGSLSGIQVFKYLSTHEDTDDAYITAHVHPVSSRIDGTVQAVLVDDNEHVTAGQTLVVLDPRDYQVKVEQALAALKSAQSQAQAAKSSITLASTNANAQSMQASGTVSNAEAAIAKFQAAVEEAQADVPRLQAQLAQKDAEAIRAAADRERYTLLAKQGAVSFQQRDMAVRDSEVADQAVNEAREGVKQSVARLEEAKQAVLTADADLVHSKGEVEQAQASHVQTQVNTAQYDVAKAAIDQAQAQLRDAQLQLSYTSITAPTSGRIGKKTVEVGQRLQTGQPLLSVVEDNDWVVANFKETQLGKLRPNQKAELTIDSLPNHKFTGTVDSVSPGSGGTFALLPADNATGNFTKIVQRVPVKILFDSASIRGYESLLTPGLSVVVNVNVPAEL